MKKKVKKKIVVQVDGEHKVKDALLKKALGFTVEELTEEYNFVENEAVLTKRKRTKKHYPPDLSAIQLVLNNLDNFTHLERLNIKQLEAEKEKLIKKLINKKGEKA